MCKKSTQIIFDYFRFSFSFHSTHFTYTFLPTIIRTPLCIRQRKSKTKTFKPTQKNFHDIWKASIVFLSEHERRFTTLHSTNIQAHERTKSFRRANRLLS